MWHVYRCSCWSLGPNPFVRNEKVGLWQFTRRHAYNQRHNRHGRTILLDVYQHCCFFPFSLEFTFSHLFLLLFSTVKAVRFSTIIFSGEKHDRRKKFLPDFFVSKTNIHWGTAMTYSNIKAALSSLSTPVRLEHVFIVWKVGSWARMRSPDMNESYEQEWGIFKSKDHFQRAVYLRTWKLFLKKLTFAVTVEGALRATHSHWLSSLLITRLPSDHSQL